MYLNIKLKLHYVNTTYVVGWCLKVVWDVRQIRDTEMKREKQESELATGEVEVKLQYWNQGETPRGEIYVRPRQESRRGNLLRWTSILPPASCADWVLKYASVYIFGVAFICLRANKWESDLY